MNRPTKQKQRRAALHTPRPDYSGPWIHTLRAGPRGRRAKLLGDWSALVRPQNVPEVPRELNVAFTFTPAGQKLISGTMSFTSWMPGRGLVSNDIMGGFYNENCLRFVYTNVEDAIQGWGEILLEFSPDSNRLTGRIIGWS